MDLARITISLIEELRCGLCGREISNGDAYLPLWRDDDNPEAYWIVEDVWCWDCYEKETTGE